ncbi:MAG: 1-(5-phosphoribosyl)-5-[(5-phosphoribosylamino)methylideneamino]imidazole-4-carboxamide isomerase [Acetobacter sp.]|nr:1-(5-phosphoribosyl)-5-[(5-phosphoribosylamino)methylideneamino]imidazole-4-carboxamide isomerase [Bacteroides sp.]MCM1340690.1 1-(5-phosphoribosyl)-5-[(5-phosphoribosylamino)methylideneamino]imidazole-4-carboxamide isomerase [Acetobacter sp.]MCM1433801.1 1-(5-phosphoribosyl)-5-[(5-phosphoribosylamino)methylideneamino]imidazole-4-carboxamide isomerase [Clostridiales bacterium]
MIIFPAIDIIDGKPVRLYKGDFSTAKQVASDALETAESFEKAGCTWIHMVDLDGSLKKEPVNSETFIRVANETNLKVELGGGIRTMNDIDFYVNNGISRIILGSVALKNPKLVEEAVKEFGDVIAVGIDAKNGYAAAEGWVQNSDVYFTDLAKQMEAVGVKTIIYTDIGKDGTLSGPNIEQLVEINEAVSCNITASGGVTSITDILALRDKKLYGAICGKSIYKQTLDLREAVEVCK